MQIRERFPFDGPGDLARDQFNGWKYVRLAAGTAADGTQVFYAELGAAAGFRFVVAYTPDGDVGLGYQLHASVLVRVQPEAREKLAELLRWAADRATAQGTLDRLLPIREVPGFDADGRHQHGWRSYSDVARQLPAPDWAPEADVYDIREGVYLSFPDGSSRLAQRRAYWVAWRTFPDAPIARQGDLLVFAQLPRWESRDREAMDVLRQSGRAIATKESGQGWPVLNQTVSLDRHTIERDGDRVVITHPEHDTVTVNADQAAWICLAPGSSRPFRRGYGD